MNRLFNKISTGLLSVLLFAACQDKDLPGSGEMLLSTPDAAAITGTLTGDFKYDYTLTWGESPQGATMNVAVYKNGNQIQGLIPATGNTFTLKNLETNQFYEFLFKYAKDGALSNGTMTSYTRLGATAPTDLKMDQVDVSEEEHNLNITWKGSSDATSYLLHLENGDGSRSETATVEGTEYLLG